MNSQATALSYPYAPADLSVVPDHNAPSPGVSSSRRQAFYSPQSPVITAPQAPQVAPRRATPRYKTTAHRWQRARQVAVVGLMAFGLLHAGGSVWTGAQRLVCLIQHQQVIEQFDQALNRKNSALKQDIARYASPTGVEELARNQLEWVGQDEILVRTRP